MDKGQQLITEKLVNDNGCTRDDVAAVTAKNCPELTCDTGANAANISIQACKLTQRSGKEPNDKKLELKNIQEPDTEELLGSVTTYNCHGTRTSARVIQKMRQDQQTRPVTPPPNEREPSSARRDERSTTQKTPSQVRANRPTWSNVERNHFFDALNEFGKDFEAIGNFINAKLKRRSPATDVTFKTKDQVRQHYYQTYHKICKYTRFSEEVRKPVQELYALINYGEMRRKLQFVTDKHFMKLRNLIYHGHISVRCKGKNIRIKTPSCKALRRLNQLDDSLEDIRLPSKIEVIISPANMEAFGRVQTIAQNPKCRTTVPLHKKLVNFIKTFEYKWRSMDSRIVEEAKHLNTQDTCTTPTQPQSISNTTLNDLSVQDPEICFLPKPGVPIHRPLLSITEYLSSVNICLTAYEERIGVKVKGEHFHADRCSSSNLTNSNSTSLQSSSNPNISNYNKRLRTESGSEKRSPEQLKKVKHLDNSYENLLQTVEETPENDSFHHAKNESSGDELSDELQDLLSDSNEINNSKEYLVMPHSHTTQLPPPTLATSNQNTAELPTNLNCMPQMNTAVARSKRSIGTKAATTSRSVFKPLLNDEVIQRIRNGWTSSTSGDITIGDLYVVFGHDSKLELDYYWLSDSKEVTTNNKTLTKCESHENSVLAKQNSSTATLKQTNNSAQDYEERSLHTSSIQSSNLSNKLKQLLLIANLSERMRRRPCNCERNNAVKVKFERDLSGRTFVASKTLSNCKVNTNDCNSGNIFRQPMIPVRRTSIDPVKQLTTLTRQKMSRQVLVQRLLLPGNGNVNSTIQTNNNSIKTSGGEIVTTSSPLSAAEANTTTTQQCKSKTKPATTTITTETTAVASNETTATADDCNATFLNALALSDFEELPQSITSQYQQHYRDIQEQIRIE
ncbi:hypothetical protein DOY81_011683 [Sarcophaga bullata]|nr:hypothetical protein DOY81_011683 [Sarcophaga bullata]